MRARRYSACESATTVRDDDRIHVAHVFKYLGRDCRVAGHDRRIGKRMYEETFHRRMTAIDECFPPFIERNLHHASAKSLNGVSFCFRRRIGNNHAARNSELARAPGNALSHIAGARRIHAVRKSLAASDRHCVGRPAQLERPDRLKVLQLEIDLRPGGRRKPNQRSTHRNPRQTGAGSRHIIGRKWSYIELGDIGDQH